MARNSASAKGRKPSTGGAKTPASAKTSKAERPGALQKLVHDDKISESSHHRAWFRGDHTNLAPKKPRMIPEDAVSKWVLKGWLPETPAITPDTQITAFGSCFAQNISNWLVKRNFRVLTGSDTPSDAYVVKMGEGMVNSFVIRQQFEWAWENKRFEGELWHGYDATSYGYDPEVQAQTRAIFDTTDVFILTFGLSEVWYDAPSGNVFWRTIPKDAYDPERHKFRVSTVEENRDNLEAIYQLIRKHRPDAKIIFTLSPIPLSATFRDNSCISSNTVSKAVLRVAIDEVVRAHHDEGALYYWPSYEIVTDVFRMPLMEDRRHVVRPVLDYIMIEFEHHWCINADAPLPDQREAWIKALSAAHILPPRIERIIANRNMAALEKMIGREKYTGEEAEDAAVRKLLGALAEDWRKEAAAV